MTDIIQISQEDWMKVYTARTKGAAAYQLVGEVTAHQGDDG